MTGRGGLATYEASYGQDPPGAVEAGKGYMGGADVGAGENG